MLITKKYLIQGFNIGLTKDVRKKSLLLEFRPTEDPGHSQVLPRLFCLPLLERGTQERFLSQGDFSCTTRSASLSRVEAGPMWLIPLVRWDHMLTLAPSGWAMMMSTWWRSRLNTSFNISSAEECSGIFRQMISRTCVEVGNIP